MTAVIGPVPSPSPSPRPLAPAHPRAAPCWRVTVVRPDDAPALRDLLDACSPETLRLRFLGPRRDFPPDYLAEVLAGRPERHDAVAAYAPGAGSPRLVGLGSLALPPGAPAAEVGLLVADAWQRQGAGGALLDVLLVRARARGVRRVSASVLHGRSALLAALGRRLPAEHLAYGADGPSGVYKLDAP
jgi:GNAT superfamily N-acetyltransferase